MAYFSLYIYKLSFIFCYNLSSDIFFPFFNFCVDNIIIRSYMYSRHWVEFVFCCNYKFLFHQRFNCFIILSFSNPYFFPPIFSLLCNPIFAFAFPVTLIVLIAYILTLLLLSLLGANQYKILDKSVPSIKSPVMSMYLWNVWLHLADDKKLTFVWISFSDSILFTSVPITPWFI